MKHKKSRIISLVLTALLILSGVCFEEIKRDSAYVCTALDSEESCLCSCGIHQAEQACSPGIYSGAKLQQAVCGGANPKREIKLSPLFVCSGFFFSAEVSVTRSIFPVQENGTGLGERITDFIHSSDGKKRRAA